MPRTDEPNVPKHTFETVLGGIPKMSKKLTGKALVKLEADPDVWQEVLEVTKAKNMQKLGVEILLVDREDGYIRDIAEHMQDLNWKPVVVSDYREARDRLKVEHFDACCIDVRLDGENEIGLDLLKELHFVKAIPTIALSTEKRVDEAAIRAGAELAMTRPESPEALEDIISSILIRSRMQRERHSCFISYSHKDESFAKKLHFDLQKAAVGCWFAPHDLKIGARTRNAIHDAIKSHEKLLLVISCNSIESDWVDDEVSRALELERLQKKPVLFPIRIDDAVMNADAGWPATIQGTRNIGNFTNWKRNSKAYRKAFNRLLRDLIKS
jgi:DNA-binding response OmpR family regulator